MKHRLFDQTKAQTTNISYPLMRVASYDKRYAKDHFPLYLTLMNNNI
jgi:hypothetical protein